MKTLLISTSSSDVSRLNRMDVSYPLGLGYLGAVLEKAGHETACMDMYCLPWKKAKPLFEKKLAEYKPDVVCLSCLTMNRYSTYEAINLIKKQRPSTMVVVGGCHASCMYEQMLNNIQGIDAIVLGEGESTIVELMEAFTRNPTDHSELFDVNGIAFKGYETIIKTEEREYIQDLDSLPFPKHEYFKDILETRRHGYIMAQRGCPFRCSFCSTSLHWGNVARRRSPKNVVDEIQHLVELYNVNHIFFMDDTFNLNPAWVIEICKEILSRGIKCEFTCYGRVHPISAEMLDWMYRAGFRNMGFGVESGSTHILKSMHKTFTIEQILNAARLLTASGLNFSFFIVVGHPGEGWDTINETIGLWQEVGRIRGRPLDNQNVPILWIFPNTEIYRLAKERGVIDDDYWLGDGIKYYTGEHDAKTLRRMSDKVLRSIQTSFGHWYYLSKILPVQTKLQLHKIKLSITER